MTQLISLTDLARKSDLTKTLTGSLLAKAELAPLFTMPQGRGQVEVYDTAAAEAVITKYKADLEARTAQAAKQKEEAQPATSTKELLEVFTRMRSAVEDQLQIMASGVDAVDETTTQLTEKFDRLEQQNVLMNGRIGRVISMLEALAESLAKPGEAPLLPTLAPTFSEPPPPVAAPAPVQPIKPLKPRVLVIGLLPSQSNEISREFGEAFDFTFVDMDVLRRRHNTMGVDRYDVVITMTKFVSHAAEEIKGKAKRLERVNGGVSSLKTKLTELFLEQPKLETARA